ncbi:YjbE family integral membrane protein [Tumebacillus sp. BK434]|uniref:TerC family protein n=1 Tax=Tumebacillus sp. BK434 TaxID=2512169 RepID=UPI00104C3C8E|nr:TerC family protein [Tumebacillus sp. BK434]TCP52352.1 YjbE family integral membrane protein [Tumebacillus sp. BK434]
MLADSFAAELIKLILINIVLSCDNALLIALVCRNLPAQLQKKAFWWGSMGTVVLKVALTFIAARLLEIPFLQAAGGVLLVYIAISLLRQEHEQTQAQSRQSTLWSAVKTIMIADLVMSVDNTVAVAAVAGGDLLLIGIGLLVSVPVIMFGAGLVTRIMHRYPYVITLAAAFLGYTAWELVREDRFVGPYLTTHLTQAEAFIPWLLVAAFLLYGRKQQNRVVSVPFSRK